VIRAATLLLALTAALLASATPGLAASDAGECKGLKICVPVKGPWVAIPAPGGLATAARWQL
jgi:hypothetical protein